MTALTDAELIAAVGWKLCQWESRTFRGKERSDCLTHGVRNLSGPHPPFCIVMCDRLEYAREGIDLARDGIADTLAAEEREAPKHDGFAKGLASGLVLASQIAREWQS